VDEYADFFPQLAVAAALLLTALAATSFLGRLHVPSPAAFLAVGIAAGLLDVGPAKDLSAASLEQIGAVALMVILFQGGLATGFGAWKRAARPILLLSLPGTAATAAGLALVGKVALGFDWSIALLVGVALAPTDPAAVYAVLRGRSGAERPRTILEGESGFNDPVAISLMVAVTAGLATGDSNVTEGAMRFVQELGIGLVAGAVGGVLLRAALGVTPRLEQGVQAIALLLGAVLLGSLTATVHGSGFLAVYVAGLLLSDAWTEQDGTRHAVPEALSAVGELLLFAMLGAVFAPLVGGIDLARGMALTLVTVFVLRPLAASVCLVGSRLRVRERVLVSWGGLKGAVPLLLAAYPALDDLDGATTVAATVLVATAASLMAQGVTLPRIADRARGS
jgi:potassium/hydrogen antiporter